jgi:RNA 3'-terminal phosphate cyclase
MPEAGTTEAVRGVALCSHLKGRRVADRLCSDLTAGASVDRYLADQLIPFAALARGESVYRVPFATEHVATRLWLAEELLGAKPDMHERVLRIQGIGQGMHGPVPEGRE